MFQNHSTRPTEKREAERGHKEDEKDKGGGEGGKGERGKKDLTLGALSRSHFHSPSCINLGNIFPYTVKMMTRKLTIRTYRAAREVTYKTRRHVGSDLSSI